MTNHKHIVVAFSIVIMGALAIASPTPQPDEVKAKVKALVEQLETGSDTQRTAAEWALIKLGPDILPLLPDQKNERLAAVQATLKELLPRTWTAEAAEMPLAEALKDLKKATGLALVDRRQGANASGVKLDALKAATYWEAVQMLIAKTNSRLSLYQPDGQVALVDGPTPKQPVVLHGPFRIAVKRIEAMHDLESQTHTGALRLEIAWEPRFAPYLIEAGKMSFQTLKGGKPVTTHTHGGSPLFVPEHNAKEFDVTFPSPPRSAGSIQNVAGAFVVTMPSKSLDFAFHKLKAGDNDSKDSVNLTISKVAADKDWWTVELKVAVPAAAPKFDSFQAWLGSGAWLDRASCQFEKGAGENKEVLRPDPLHTRIGPRTPTEVSVRYQFKPPSPGAKMQEWRLACRVPGRMVEITVPFSFPSITLP